MYGSVGTHPGDANGMEALNESNLILMKLMNITVDSLFTRTLQGSRSGV